MDESIIKIVEEFAYNNSVWAYLFFFINSIMQGLFPPYPGDTVIVLQGYLGSLFIFNPYLIVISTISGTIISGMILFSLSSKYGHKILGNKFFIRFFDIRKTMRLGKVFKKYGAALIIFNRFVPGLSMITILAAGMFNINKTKAYISIVISSILHNFTLLVLGYTLGYNLPLLKEVIHRFNTLFIILAALIGLVILIVYFFRNKIFRNKNTA